NTIRFSHDTIKSTFTEGGEVAQMTADLKAGTLAPSSVAPISIVEKNGMIYTLDNRRLKAFRDAGVAIPYKRLDSVPLNQLFKFTTENDGIDILIRGRNDE